MNHVIFQMILISGLMATMRGLSPERPHNDERDRKISFSTAPIPVSFDLWSPIDLRFAIITHVSRVEVRWELWLIIPASLRKITVAVISDSLLELHQTNCTHSGDLFSGFWRPVLYNRVYWAIARINQYKQGWSLIFSSTVSCRYNFCAILGSSCRFLQSETIC